MHFWFIPTCGLKKGGGERGLLAIFFSWIPAIVRSPLHCKKGLSKFPSPAGMSLIKLSRAGNKKIFPARKSLVSDIPAGEWKITHLFTVFTCTCTLHIEIGSRQRILKLRWWWWTSIGYESRKCICCRGGLLGGQKSTQVKHKHILVLFPSACRSQLKTEVLPGSWPGRYMRTDSPNNTVSVWYHSLSGTLIFRLQKYYMYATSQARLKGVLGRTSMYETFLTYIHK